MSNSPLLEFADSCEITKQPEIETLRRLDAKLIGELRALATSPHSADRGHDFIDAFWSYDAAEKAIKARYRANHTTP